MEALHLPDNIKVHFAGAEVQNQFIAVHKMGVQYSLYTAFPFVERMVFDKAKSPIMPLEWHHMMPFFGKYCIAYIPNENGRILGISKIGRVVDYCSAKLQLQERLAGDIIKMLEGALQDENNPPKGFAIMMKGKHLCKSMRGVKKDGNMTVLHCTGIFKTDKELQKQFVDIAEKQI